MKPEDVFGLPAQLRERNITRAALLPEGSKRSGSWLHRRARAAGDGVIRLHAACAPPQRGGPGQGAESEASSTALGCRGQPFVTEPLPEATGPVRENTPQLPRTAYARLRHHRLP